MLLFLVVKAERHFDRSELFFFGDFRALFWRPRARRRPRDVLRRRAVRGARRVRLRRFRRRGWIVVFGVGRRLLALVLRSLLRTMDALWLFMIRARTKCCRCCDLALRAFFRGETFWLLKRCRKLVKSLLCNRRGNMHKRFLSNLLLVLLLFFVQCRKTRLFEWFLQTG